MERKLLSRLQKTFTENQWYKQGAAVKHLYIGFPWHTCYLPFTVNYKSIKSNYCGLVCAVANDFCEMFFPRAVLKKVARYYYLRELKNPGFFEKNRTFWENIKASKFRKLLNTLQTQDFFEWPNQKLVRMFKMFCLTYQNLWREAIFLDAFDCESETILNKMIKKYRLNLKLKNLQILTLPTQLSWLQQEQKSLFNLARIKNLKSKQKALETHAKNFHWIYNDFALIKHLDTVFFKNRIKLLAKDHNAFFDGLKELFKIRQTKQRLAKKYLLPKIAITTFNFISSLAQWRDSRKAHNQMANYIIQKFARAFSIRTNYQLNDLEHLFWWELLNIFKLSPQTIKQTRQRAKFCFYAGDPRNPQNHILGSKGKKLRKTLEKQINQNNSLKGNMAFPGIACGKAKLIATQKDFKKFKKGDILIAPNTRPEYVPLMKIASAIITEEGGLTCHAAITARELKKPCIVGMQGIMAKIKNRQLIEVNAQKGAIKFL